jgi:thiol:disulfide interchange protein
VGVVSEEIPTERPPATGWALFASVVKAILTGNRKEDKNARLMAALLAVIAILGGVVIRGDARTDRVLASQERAIEQARQDNKEFKEAVLDLAAQVRETNEFMRVVVVDRTAKTPREVRKRYVPKPEPRSP